MLAGIAGFVFWKFHALAEPARPMPTEAELANRDLEDLHKEATALVWPYLIVAGKPRKPLTSRADRSSITRGIALLKGVAARTQGNWSAEWCIGKAYQTSGETEAALAHFGTAFAYNPRQADVAREYIAACLALGRGEPAVAACREICALLPADAGLRANLAYALLIAGDVEGARLEIEQAISLDPNDTVSEKLRALILAVQAGSARRPTRLDPPRV